MEDNLGFKKAGSVKKKEGEAQAVHVEFQPNYAPYPFYPSYAPQYPLFNNVAINPYVYQPPKPIVPPTPAMNTGFATQPPRNNQPENRNAN